MKRLVIFLSLCASAVMSQNAVNIGESSFADSLLKLANRVFYSNPDSSYVYSALSLDLASRNNLPRQKALAWHSMARTEVLRGDIELALLHLRNAVAVFENQQAMDQVAKCYSLMSTAVSKIGNHKESIGFLLKAIAIYRETGNVQGLTATLVNLANVYCDVGVYDKALDALNESKQYTRPGDNHWFYYFINAGIIHMHQKNYRLAEAEFDSCLAISARNKMVDAEVTALTKQGELFMESKRFGEALGYFDRAITMARINDLPIEESEALSGLIAQAEATGDYRTAFISQKRQRTISDSLFNIEKIKNISAIESKLKLSEKEKTIALQRLDMQRAAAEQEKSHKRVLMLIAGSSLLLVVLFFILYVFVKTRKQKREVEIQKNRAERFNSLNQKIFAVIAHDFKSPMIALNMLSDLLDKENISKEDLLGYSADVRNQVTQSGQILDNLLNWARTELNVSYNVGQHSSPNLVTEEIKKELHLMCLRKDIVINNHVPPSMMLRVPADILRIILRNLLSNAVKFSYSNSSIEVGVAGDAIFVADLGQGVQEKTLNELFNGTVQSRLGTFNETGFGLGLYITHELISKFGGKIRVENNHPSGTVFKFVINQHEQDQNRNN